VALVNFAVSKQTTSLWRNAIAMRTACVPLKLQQRRKPAKTTIIAFASALAETWRNERQACHRVTASPKATGCAGEGDFHVARGSGRNEGCMRWIFASLRDGAWALGRA